MAAMHTVEIADRDDGAAPLRRQVVERCGAASGSVIGLSAADGACGVRRRQTSPPVQRSRQEATAVSPSAREPRGRPVPDRVRRRPEIRFVDAAGDEEDIDAGVDGAADVGGQAVADRQDRGRRRAAPADRAAAT